MRKVNTKIGTIYSWYDFIKPKKNKVTNTMTYSQSNTKLDNYSQRYVGLFLSHNEEIYVAVAVNKKGDAGNWWKFIIENRIGKALRNGGTINENDRGITMVPMPYKDLLFKDPHAYTNLYGIIDPTYLDMAIKEATRANNQLVDSYAGSRSRT
tara:strand:- start:193207 stop:193665 length:459 start_codon:yes stop_codon:yes gene_type:complete